MMAKTRRQVLALVLALSCRAGVASAEVGASVALFTSGREAYGRGDFEGARAKFEESERLEPAVGTELNLALCDEQLGDLVAAWRLLQLVRDKLSSSDARAEIARSHLAQVERRLPRVTLVGGEDLPADADIVVGATRLTRSGLGIPMPMDVGQVVVSVRAPGRARHQYALRLDEGSRMTLVLEAGPLEPRSPRVDEARAARSQNPPDGRRAWGVLSLGAGASLAVVGAVAGVQVLKAKAAMAEECNVAHACSADGVAVAQRGERWATFSTLAFGLAAGCGAIGVWILLGEHVAHDSHRLSLGVHTNGVALRGGFP